MVATVKSGLAVPEDDVLPGPIKLHSKAATVYKRAMDDQDSRRIAESASCRRTRWRVRKKTGAATSSSPRRPADPPESCRRSSMPWAKEVASFRWRRFATACLRRRRLVTLQAQCDAVCCRRRLPGGDRRRVGDGRGIDRDGIRRGIQSRRERRGVGAGTSPGNDLRSGRRVRAGSVHRAMRIRRGQGLDGLRDRQQ